MRWKLLVSLVVSVLACAASADDVGLLLGLGGPNGTGSTVWVGRQGVAVFARRAGDGYWLWEDAGFWHVLDEDLSRSGGRATVSITDREGQTSMYAWKSEMPETSYIVSYVSPKALGLKSRPDFEPPFLFAGAGFAPWGGTGVYYRNVFWSVTSVSMRVGQALGELMAENFKKSAAEAIQGPGIVYQAKVSAEDWTLIRERGAWMLAGILYPDWGSGLEPGEFIVGEVRDRGFGAHGSQRPNWSRIVSEYPNATDYATSPDSSLTVIVTPTDVFVHRSSSGSLGRRVQRVHVASTRIVMTQWFEGGDVRKVAGEVAKIRR